MLKSNEQLSVEFDRCEFSRSVDISSIITDETDIFLREKLSTSLTLNDSDVIIEEISTERENSHLSNSTDNCSFELALPLYERLQMNSK